MFKIIYDLSKSERNGWASRYKTKDYPNFSLVKSTTETLEIGTRFILRDEDDGSYWFGQWSVGLYNDDSYKIRKIINIDAFLDKKYNNIEYISDSMLYSEYYYIFDKSRGYRNCDILDYTKFDVYKLPNSEFPREWLYSNTGYKHSTEREEDKEYLYNLYLNPNSQDFLDYKTDYPTSKNSPILAFINDIKIIKRDIRLSSILEK